MDPGLHCSLLPESSVTSCLETYHTDLPQKEIDYNLEVSSRTNSFSPKLLLFKYFFPPQKEIKTRIVNIRKKFKGINHFRTILTVW